MKKVSVIVVCLILVLSMVACDNANTADIETNVPNPNQELDKSNDNESMAPSVSESVSEPDVTDWTAIEQDDVILHKVVNNGSIYVGYDYDSLSYSKDGLNWTVALEGELYLVNIYVANNAFYAHSAGHDEYKSLDGINWTTFDIPIDTDYITKCAVPLNDQYVGINENGYVTFSADGEIFEELLQSDGLRFKLMDSENYGFAPIDMKVINNKIYATAFDSSIYVGTALDQWTRYDASGYDYSWFNDVASFNNEIYVVGTEGVFTINGDHLEAIVNEYLSEDEYVSVLNYKDKLIFVGSNGQVVSTSDGNSFDHILEGKGIWLKTLTAYIVDDMLVASKDDGAIYYLTLD